ncbi:protein ORF14 [Cyprinid herpesvirus 3]|nr:protein ORF14 [Cyprinid herpesvirus 3]AJP55665.1 protein ORF14 [Cyprinid herpesvirus 3]AVL27791.1 protein ORF14 [Cyprinid herpesvirus 3]
MDASNATNATTTIFHQFAEHKPTHFAEVDNNIIYVYVSIGLLLTIGLVVGIWAAWKAGARAKGTSSSIDVEVTLINRVASKIRGYNILPPV